MYQSTCLYSTLANVALVLTTKKTTCRLDCKHPQWARPPPDVANVDQAANLQQTEEKDMIDLNRLILI